MLMSEPFRTTGPPPSLSSLPPPFSAPMAPRSVTMGAFTV